MATKSAFSILGLTHKFALAFEKAGGTPEELNFLAEDSEMLPGLIKTMRIYRRNLGCIDCDVDPEKLGFCVVEEHRKDGKIMWDPAAVTLHLSEGQKGSGLLSGGKLREELKDRPVLNASVLDYLLDHPELIPDEWKGVIVFFWGTVYVKDAGFYIRCLRWRSGKWCSEYYDSSSRWGASCPALIFASKKAA